MKVLDAKKGSEICLQLNYFDEKNESPRIQDAAKSPGIHHKNKVLYNNILKLLNRIALGK